MITFKPDISYEQLKEIKKTGHKLVQLGSGQLGTVYKGEWKGVAVAIKVFYAKTLFEREKNH